MLKEYCRSWNIEFDVFKFRPLNRTQLATVVSKRFSPNQFDDQFFDFIFEYSRGNTQKIAIVINKLLAKNLLITKDNCWHYKNLPGDKFNGLSAEFLEPIEQVLDECAGNYGPQIYEFLCLLALCGGIGPVVLIYEYLGLDKNQQEEMDDLLEKYLISTYPNWMDDYGYNHPSFKGHLIYGFKHDYSVQMMMQSQEKEKENRAASLFNYLNQKMNIDTKAKASIMLRLAEIGKLTDRIDQFNIALLWWIESAFADELKDILVDLIKKDELRPTSLWLYINKNEERLPAVIILALLDAYREHSGSMPSDNFLPFVIMRSNSLYRLGRFSEALEDLNDASSVDIGYNKYLDIAIKSLTGHCHQALGSYQRARPYFEKALEI